MKLVKATDSDLAAAAALVNSAYRGDSSRQGWTTEADLVDGQRTDPATLAEELATIPGAKLMLFKVDGEIRGTVWLEPKSETAWYLGMLVVRPGEQDQGSGRAIMAAAEDLVRAEGGKTLEMTVISVRAELIAWYERRGYAKTGEIRPFPYDIPRFGEPQVPGLEFVVLQKTL